MERPPLDPDLRPVPESDPTSDPVPDSPSGLTRLELRLMQIIWKHGKSTVGAVQEKLDPPLAYTTVQTVLNILERKGKLRRARNGRAFVYSATVTEARASGQSLRDLIDRMFGGSSEDLVMSLLRNRHIDATQLADITERFHQKAGVQSKEPGGVRSKEPAGEPNAQPRQRARKQADIPAADIQAKEQP